MLFDWQFFLNQYLTDNRIYRIMAFNKKAAKQRLRLNILY